MKLPFRGQPLAQLEAVRILDEAFQKTLHDLLLTVLPREYLYVSLLDARKPGGNGTRNSPSPAAVTASCRGGSRVYGHGLAAKHQDDGIES